MPFPDPATVRGDVTAWSTHISADLLESAYSKGIFPWPDPEMTEVPWCCPRRRGVLFFEDLHLPRSFQRWRRTTGVELKTTIDTSFGAVVDRCAASHHPSWITPDLREAYVGLHKRGKAHSLEVWRDEKLVGGIYGVDAGGVFSGESMFFEESGASKLALVCLIEHLKENGATWIDTQMVTPLTEMFGGKLIARSLFLKQLAQTQAEGLRLFQTQTVARRPSW